MPGTLMSVLPRKDFRRDVLPFDRLADELVVLRVFRLCLAGRVKRIADLAVPSECDVKIAAADQFGVADASRHFGIAVNHAAIDRQLFAGDAKFFARKFDKDAARFSRRGAQLLAAFCNARRARGAALIDAAPGIASGNLDGVERHVEFLGNHLRERDLEALPEIGLAGKN